MKGNTFKKTVIVCLAMAFLTLSFLGCDNKKNSNITLATPYKIIIYYNNQSKEIYNTNDEFKDIVKLTNERFSKEKLVVIQDIVTNEFVDNLKKEQLSIEFVYNDEQKMDTKINELSEIKYNRLFFNLVNESPEYKTSHASTFQYGNKGNYMKSSFGTLEQCKKLKHLSSNILQKLYILEIFHHFIYIYMNTLYNFTVYTNQFTIYSDKLWLKITDFLLEIFLRRFHP